MPELRRRIRGESPGFETSPRSRALAVSVPAVAAIALGVAGSAGARVPVPVLGDLALMVVGVGVLATDLAVRRRRQLRRLRDSSGAARAALSRPDGSGRIGTPASTRMPVPFAGTGAHSHLPVLSASTVAGERLWATWRSVQPSHLPVDLVGPVPETAYVAPRSGGFVPFPGKEPELSRVPAPTHLRPGRLSVVAPADTSAVEPWDLALPAIGTRPDFAAFETMAAPAPWGPAGNDVGAPGTACGASGGPTEGMVPRMRAVSSPGTGFETVEEWVRWEASAPMPPHLRGPTNGPPGDGGARPPPGDPRTRTAPRAVRSECASCADEVVGLRSWAPCGACDRPVCLACLRDSFVAFGHGWCRACATSNALVIS